jgi:hypothetical protein
MGCRLYIVLVTQIRERSGLWVSLPPLIYGQLPSPHFAGSIGNSLWTGVYLRDVLKACGFPVDDPESTGAQHVIMKVDTSGYCHVVY